MDKCHLLSVAHALTCTVKEVLDINQAWRAHYASCSPTPVTSRLGVYIPTWQEKNIEGNVFNTKLEVVTFSMKKKCIPIMLSTINAYGVILTDS